MYVLSLSVVGSRWLFLCCCCVSWNCHSRNRNRWYAATLSTFRPQHKQCCHPFSIFISHIFGAGVLLWATESTKRAPHTRHRRMVCSSHSEYIKCNGPLGCDAKNMIGEWKGKKKLREVRGKGQQEVKNSKTRALYRYEMQTKKQTPLPSFGAAAMLSDKRDRLHLVVCV